MITPGSLRERLWLVLKDKLASDVAWSVGSLVILAVSGITINILIATLRDATALGVFGQSFAVYLIAGQIAALGLHYSVLRHAALFRDEPAERDRLLINASVFALALGVAGGTLLYFAGPAIGRVFGSDDVGRTVAISAYGLALFPLTKVLLAYLNALRHMRAFAVLQSLRYLLVMAGVTVVAASAMPFHRVAYVFVCAEMLTAAGTLGYILVQRLLTSPAFDPGWTRRHFSFGSRSLLSGLFVELNARVDILIIGLFLADRDAGIYAFAAMLADGLYHLLAVVRTNFNPLLVAAISGRDWAGAQRLLRLSRTYVWPGTAVVAGGLVAAFYVLAAWVVPDKGLLQGLTAVLILLAGLTLVSGLVPFENLLLAAGHPGFQTVQHLTLVASNIALGFVLVPALGINGAAMSMAAGYLIGFAALVALGRWLVGWDLLTNTVDDKAAGGGPETTQGIETR